MHYTVFIDESGSFQPKTPSYVGGIVVTSSDRPALARVMRGKTDALNAELDKAGRTNERLNFPRDLHAIPLLNPQLRRERCHDRLSIDQATAWSFVRAIFAELRPLVRFWFKTEGRPLLYASEQASYVACLKIALERILGDATFGSGDRIDVVIAGRATMLLGEWGGANRREYEDFLAKNLVRSLRSCAGGILLGDLAIVDGANESGLIAADFFCAAQRGSQYSALLQDYSEDRRRIYPYQERISPSLIEICEKTSESDQVRTILIILDSLPDRLSGDAPEFAPLYALFAEILHDLDPDELDTLAGELDLYFKEQVVDSPERYRLLDKVERIVGFVLDRLDPLLDKEEPSPALLRLKACLLKYAYIVASHRGGSVYPAYSQFLHGRASAAYPNQLIFFQERIEAGLMSVQHEGINRFCPDAQEERLHDLVAEYKRCFGDMIESDCKDDNAARLFGSYAQILAIQYSFERDETYADLAAEYFLRDLELSRERTPSQRQCRGYLATLALMRGRVEEGAKHLLAAMSAEDKTLTDLLKEAPPSPWYDRTDPFLVLQHLRLLALAKEQGLKTIDPGSPSDDFGDLLTAQYPYCLIVKWAGVRLAQSGDIAAASALFRGALPLPKDPFIIRLVKLPNLILATKAASLTGTVFKSSLALEIAELEGLVPGTAARLAKLGIDTDPAIIDRSTWYDLAALLPFYYA